MLILDDASTGATQLFAAAVHTCGVAEPPDQMPKAAPQGRASRERASCN
ncbi:MAG: hypothetical protein K2W97_04355 [Chthoniobacterales bacterium]|nr:hypothetical protein [Chthoniobacterales bacterium]